MFPIELEHSLLDTLPLLSAGDVDRVTRLLHSIVQRRVGPYFKTRRGTDALVLGRVLDDLAIVRLEDEEQRVRAVSLSVRRDRTWTVLIHERVFDYLGFVLPSDPEHRLRDGTAEELKMLAITELMLRHELEHMLYPEHAEAEIIVADLAFAIQRRDSDPTFYRMLRNGLADELNGLKGRPYLRLLDRGEAEEPADDAVAAIIDGHVRVLADLGRDLLAEVFPQLDTEIQTALLGEIFARSRSTSYPLLQRARCLRRLFAMLSLLVSGADDRALEVLRRFQKRWGVVDLLSELDLPHGRLASEEPEALFALLKEGLDAHHEEYRGEPAPAPEPSPPPRPAQPPQKSLKDRIEEARNDLSIPRQVIGVIDKNRVNAIGHSGAKYSELIETLLAIPWGRVCPVTVSPQDFEQGLERGHYGLHRAKETLCDFFANLIWRCQRPTADPDGQWRRRGSAFLFVGPPGVGKTSLAISVAENLGIPYHKLSLGGMRDEADLRGHGFTYEGSKPGAIVQGLIKMGVMNGLYIMDEADKTEAFAIATLLEILDPEQNHLFHDKYTQTTVDIDLSNCHFILTANTLETVPPPVINRCQVVPLDRYSVDEKVAIATHFLMPRLRRTYGLTAEQLFLEPGHEHEHLRHLVVTYTHEPGVRELERILRTLFLRVQRKEILAGGAPAVCITHGLIKLHLDEPSPPRQISDADRVGEALALGVDVERGVGSVIPVQATRIPAASGPSDGWALSMVHATGNIERVMDESRKVASTAILHRAGELGIEAGEPTGPIHLHLMGGSTRKDGPSAGGAIALALASLLAGRRLRRDVAMTGEIDTHGRITGVGAVDIKLEVAASAGCRTVVIPRDNLDGPDGIERLPEALRRELQVLAVEDWEGPHEGFDYDRHLLQVVAVDDIVEAFEVAVLDDAELAAAEELFAGHARRLRRELGHREQGQRRGALAIVVKDAGDLLDGHFSDAPQPRFAATLVLAAPDLGAVLERRFPHLDPFTAVCELSPAQDDLAASLCEAMESLPAAASEDGLAVVAPFFLLRAVQGRLETLSLGGRPPALLASNYAAQGVKLKSSKARLSRLASILVGLGEEELEACPFMARLDGIWVADLRPIPEKYRLDIDRAEEILNRGLTRWLAELAGET